MPKVIPGEQERSKRSRVTIRSNRKKRTVNPKSSKVDEENRSETMEKLKRFVHTLKDNNQG